MVKRRFVVQTSEGRWLGVIADNFRAYTHALFFFNETNEGTNDTVLLLAAGSWAVMAEVPDSAEWPPHALEVIYGKDEFHNPVAKTRERMETGKC